jgi:diguanylate cyclase (GGDEF)-like protein
MDLGMEDTTKKENIDDFIGDARDRNDLFRVIFDYNADAIFVVDKSGTVIFINPSAERYFNLPASQLIGQPFRFNINDDEPCEVEIVRPGSESRIAEIRWIKAKVQDEVLYAAILRDITEFIRLREELRALSFVDELTGLFNRPGFYTLAEQQLKIASRGKSGLFLLVSAVNDLASIRNNHGDYEYDRALIETANILKSTFRRSDIVTRISIDEFAVMTLDVYGSSADVIASRLLLNLEKFNNKEILPYKITLSMGIAPFNPESPCTMMELLASADAELTKQKRSKRSSTLKWSFA